MLQSVLALTITLSSNCMQCCYHYVHNHFKRSSSKFKLSGSQTFLGLVFLGLPLVLEANSALVHLVRLHTKLPTKAFGIVWRGESST